MGNFINNANAFKRRCNGKPFKTEREMNSTKKVKVHENALRNLNEFILFELSRACQIYSFYGVHRKDFPIFFQTNVRVFPVV